MSTLFYNGIGLLRCQELSYEREPVWQGPDYLWTTHRLRVRGIYNPEVNAYSFGGANPPPQQVPAVQLNSFVPVTIPVIGANRFRSISNAGIPGNPVVAASPSMTRGVFGPITDMAVKHKLMQAGNVLSYSVGATPILVSPSVNANGSSAVSDAHNGPFPLACDVVKISGTKTFLVDYAIETYMNEAYLYKSTPCVLLSHRWKVTEDIDQDYFSTRRIEGRAQFRADRLIFLGAMPDDFRMALFHPLPGNGWKRTAVTVHVGEDGTSLEYALTDKQLALSIISDEVTRIEAWQEASANNLSIEGLVGGALKAAMDFFTFGGGSRESDITAGESAAKAGFSLVSSIVPQTQIVVVCRVWGFSDSPRKELEDVAITCVLARFDSMVNVVANYAASTEIVVRHDLAGSFVEARAIKKTSLASAPYAGLAAWSNVPNVGQYFPDDDNTKGVLTENHSAVTPLGLPNRINSRGAGTRGTFIERLVTAALLAQDATPVNPPLAMDSGNAVVDRTLP